MCEPVTLTAMASTLAANAGTIATVSALAGGAMSAYGAYQQGQVAQQVGRNNQIMAEYAAQDAQKRAGEDALKVQQKAAGLKGAQRAAMAAKGLDLGVGTQADILDQTDFFGATDAATSRNNGNRDAWSARASGSAARAQGDAAAKQGTLSAFGTLLGTAGSVSSKWYDYNGKRA